MKDKIGIELKNYLACPFICLNFFWMHQKILRKKNLQMTSNHSTNIEINTKIIWMEMNTVC